MSTNQSDVSFTRSNSVQGNVRGIKGQHSQISVLVSADLCPAIQRTLASRFQITAISADLRHDQFDAYIVDCRGKALSSTGFNSAEMNVLANFQIGLALVDEHSYLPAVPCQYFSKLELITETELNSDVLKLRIRSGLRSIQISKNTPVEDQNIIKENAYEVLQTLVQYSTDWMVIKDLDHRFALVTNPFLESRQKISTEIIGKNDLEIGTPKELVLGDRDNEWEGYWKSDDRIIASRAPTDSEQMIIHESASEQVHEHVSRVPIKNKDGDVFALLVCVTQAFTTKLNGNTISKLASRRNIESAPIIKRLDDDRSKAEAENRKSQFDIKRKNNFIATASHDLRQPLQAIGLFIEALQKTIVDTQQQTILSKMKKSSQNLNELLNSILDISKLDAEAVAVNKSHFAIEPLLKSIEDEFETEAYSKSINLCFSSSSSIVYTDNLLLSRILKNLVNNAVKYTENGSVTVITEVSEDNLAICIKDTGPGIPKEQYQSIFMEYHQLPNQHEQTNFGQGLGLSIVKRLVDLLNLDISLDSEIGQGTQFRVTVPLGESKHEKIPSQSVNESLVINSYKLLVIEDNEIVLEAMEEMLTSKNCDVYPAQNISEAQEIINELEELPDLLIVDYQLDDGVTGDMAIEQVRQTANKAIPAIIVTGNTSSALIRKATESAYRVLSKPVNPDVLLRTIRSAINENKSQPA